MWCPICKAEYQQGIDKCAECKCTLVEDLSECYENGDVTYDGFALNKLSLLCSVGDDFDADVKVSLLHSCGIKAYKKYAGFASVAKIYFGSSSIGVDIYVPTENLEEANEILNAAFDANELYSEEDASEAGTEEN